MRSSLHPLVSLPSNFWDAFRKSIVFCGVVYQVRAALISSLTDDYLT
jgi:hypothetical protein